MRTNTKRIQNIAQGYDAFELVYVSAANDGHKFEPGRAPALKHQIKRLIWVAMRALRNRVKPDTPQARRVPPQKEL